MDFFTADLHFGHAKLATERGFSSVEAHDAWLVGRINEQATAYTDTLYIVGDMSFHKMARTVEILQSIYCRKVLVKGNHDHRKKNAMGATLPAQVMTELEEFHHYLERKFMVWHDKSDGQFMEVEGEEHHIVMNHFPQMFWRNQDKGWWHLHGHLHGNPSGVPGKVMDVGWDKWEGLVTLEGMRQYMQYLPVRGNHHKEWVKTTVVCGDEVYST